YVVTCDSGFAPNPFGRFLTLATCKPRIRRSAQKGSVTDAHNRKLVYAAVVSEVVPLDQYGSSLLYKVKRPSTRGPWWRRHGDNIYLRIGGRWKRRPNDYHSGRDMMRRDLRGKNALICERFWYFGASAIWSAPQKRVQVV